MYGQYLKDVTANSYFSLRFFPNSKFTYQPTNPGTIFLKQAQICDEGWYSHFVWGHEMAVISWEHGSVNLSYQQHKRIFEVKFLSLHRAVWYSHSSFTNRCTFIKTLIKIYIKIRWLLHVPVYDYHQGAFNCAWLKLYWFENIQ